jgi:hypothetical protein
MFQRAFGFFRAGSNAEAKVGTLYGRDATVHANHGEWLSVQNLVRSVELFIKLRIRLSATKEFVALIVVGV